MIVQLLTNALFLAERPLLSHKTCAPYWLGYAAWLKDSKQHDKESKNAAAEASNQFDRYFRELKKEVGDHLKAEVEES